MVKKINFLITLVFLSFVLGCVEESFFQKNGFEFNQIKSLAIVPFEDLSFYGKASPILMSSLITELKKNQSINVTSIKPKNTYNKDSTEITIDKIKTMEGIKSDYCLFGQINEYKYKRGLGEDPIIGVHVSLYSVKTNESVWEGTININSSIIRFSESTLSSLSFQAAQRIAKKFE